ncbi:UPF0182 family membrane protein [Cellulomonas fengjieae]|uniref:UPF0182 protein J4035_03665 n=1 Tax=Cellulomonas fengjieae TaxID=2819978 RepID=A0ABS3SD96_9CELL|nr:UPF0182 family protein [Cellulomonas fengjieae]MBO3083727.1 UPF0182 family protein [Cellulomonas fengjieae]MBO3101522.1 UPF0182 family protein [Cellulomonas fengjieae]QVI64973.1 UPF0182 family protein [Cellulomonas fengjieae]
MTFGSPPPRPSPARPRRRGALAPTLVVLGVLVVAVLLLAQVWTEVLWFQQLGFTDVIRTEWLTRAALFVAGFLVMAGAVFWSLNFGYRSRPVYAPSTQEQANLDQYREAIEPLRRLVMIVGPAVLGLFAGAAASQQWQTVQLWMHGKSVGETDPQYGIDLGFYLFTLPGLRFVVSFLTAVVVLAGIGAVATQYLYGGLRVGGQRGGAPRTTRAARVQLSLIAAVLMLLIASSYWLDRYSILTKSGEKFVGASFTDVHAVIPSKAILAGIAIFVAVMFIVTAIRGNWRLPAIGVGLMVVAAIAVGGIYPAIVQRFQVQPNQQDAEAEYIKRNIDATLDAYDLTDVEKTAYDAEVTAEAGALRADADTTASIRLLDPQIVSPSFKQLEQIRAFYDFPDSLSVDRYEIDGESRDTVIAVRELSLDGLDAQQRNWTNDATVYTHGYGVVAAYGNTTAGRGAPAFWEQGIPSTGQMGPYEPRIYFSPKAPAYSIVGAPEDATPWELDYPADDSEGAVNSTFPTQEVSAGPSIGNPLAKLLYALKFGSEQILFSERVTSESQILYDRDPRDRVQKVAPYLTLDGRAYPAVVNEKVVWIVDGYTTSDQYPYAATRSLDDATTDSLTATSETVEALQPKTVNYIRNSVKATVDAYDGSVTLYAWDAEDPILRAWDSVFPSSLEPMSEIDGALMSHLRYPEDLFKVQRNLLARYHVTDAGQFFSGNDFWANPNDPTSEVAVPQPPYYLTLRMPDQDEASFSLMSSFIPTGTNARNVLTGYLAVDAEAGNEDGKVSEDYGKMRLLELPRDSTVPGPGQVNNNFVADPDVSNELNILGRGDSQVVRGNLLTLPMGGGLLYVQPVYVQARSGTTFPLLQRVLVAFGDDIGFADTLDGALDQVFGGDSGADAGDAGTDPDAETPPTQEPTDTPTDTPAAPADPGAGTGTDTTARADLDRALQQAKEAIAEGQAALATGDFATYGEAQKRLDTAIQAALDAEARLAE